METGQVKLKQHLEYTLEQEAIRIHPNLEEKLSQDAEYCILTDA